MTSLQDESRWEREVGRLQQVAAADLQRIRQEANEAAEREARLLRCAGMGIRGGTAPRALHPKGCVHE